jgi:hypothetical protein
MVIRDDDLRRQGSPGIMGEPSMQVQVATAQRVDAAQIEACVARFEEFVNWCRKEIRETYLKSSSTPH